MEKATVKLHTRLRRSVGKEQHSKGAYSISIPSRNLNEKKWPKMLRIGFLDSLERNRDVEK